jgi:hypothetical protein
MIVALVFLNDIDIVIGVNKIERLQVKVNIGVSMAGIKINDGRFVDTRQLCRACKQGCLIISESRTVIKVCGSEMYKEVWKCDNCDGESFRQWTK